MSKINPPDETNLFTASPSVQSDRILYTPSSFARTALLHLQETGTLRALSSHTSKRTGLSSYLCFVVLDGRGKLDYNGKTYTLGKGDCAFIDCRKPYSHSTSKPNLWSLSWAHFYGSNLSTIYDKYLERGGQPTLRPQDPAAYIELFQSLYGLAASHDYIRDMRIHEKLSQLLTLIMEVSWNPDGARASTGRLEVSRVKEYLDEHYAQPVSLDELSKSFFINKFYLSKIFKEQYGQTINAYVLHKRITTAKQLLRFTDRSIESIAMEVGIPDANYFARAFKKVEGTTPGEYRRAW